MLSGRDIRVSAVSHNVADFARNGAGIESRVILNGLDTAHYTYQPDIRPIRVLGTAGRLDDQKNYCALVRAFAKLQNRELKLRIAGDGVQHTQLKSLIDELDLSDRVELCGYRNDIIAFFGEIDGFVCSSIYEGLNLIVIEAVLLGKPVISTRVGVVLEAPDLGIPLMGFDDSEMSRAIDHWVGSNTEDIAQQVRDYREYAEKHFNLSTIYREYCQYMWPGQSD